MNINFFKSLNILSILSLSMAVIGWMNENMWLSWSGITLAVIFWGTGALLAPMKKARQRSLLPAKKIKQVRKSLHHSQVPLFHEVIEPVMAVYLSALAVQHPMQFEKKCEALMQAFAYLKTSKALYLNRGRIEKDKALTLFVFLAILFSEKNESELMRDLSRLPGFIYSVIKKEAYRLFDLSVFLLQGQLFCNTDEKALIAEIPAFHQIKPTPSEDFDAAPVLDEKASPAQSMAIKEGPQKEDEPKQDCISEVQDELPVSISESDASTKTPLLEPFLSWLEKRMQSNNRAYHPEQQQLIKTSSQWGHDILFVGQEVLMKYQSRSGVLKEEMQEALTRAFNGDTFFINEDNESLTLYPVRLDAELEITTQSDICKGGQ